MYDIRKINIWKTEENKQEDREWLEAGIEELNLTTRPYNSLKRAGCHTVEDIVLILDSEGNGLKGIRNLGARSEKEILDQLEWFRSEYSKRRLAAPDLRSQKEKDAGEERAFARRTEVRKKKDVWEADIESLHLSDYALNKLKDCRITKVKDLYATNPKSEPGWYAVRELLEKI